MAVKTTTAPSDRTFFIEKSEFGEYNKMVSVEFTYNATFLNNKDLDKAVLSVPYGNAAKDYFKNCLGKIINADGGLLSVKKSFDSFAYFTSSGWTSRTVKVLTLPD